MFCIDPILQMIYKCFKKNTERQQYQPMINMSINGCENIYISSDTENSNKLDLDSKDTIYNNRLQLDKKVSLDTDNDQKEITPSTNNNLNKTHHLDHNTNNNTNNDCSNL